MKKNKIDFAALRSIPILDVARELGVEVKGTKAMCFAGHDNKTPSLSFWKEKNMGFSIPLELVRPIAGTVMADASKSS